jgi:hypothetical protein
VAGIAAVADSMAAVDFTAEEVSAAAGFVVVVHISAVEASAVMLLGAVVSAVVAAISLPRISRVLRIFPVRSRGQVFMADAVGAHSRIGHPSDALRISPHRLPSRAAVPSDRGKPPMPAVTRGPCEMPSTRGR